MTGSASFNLRSIGSRLRIAAFLLLTAAASLPVGATTLVRFQELPILMSETRRAVVGTVTSVHYGYDERKLHSTFVTVRVEERVYDDEGSVPDAGGLLQLKFYGAPQAMPDGSRLFIEGTPGYAIGDHLFLLLRETSVWGFTSAAGLSQGAFRLSGADEGRLMASSLGGNRRVLGEEGLGRWLDQRQVSPEDIPFLSPTDGPVPLDTLRRAVLQLRTNGPDAGVRQMGGGR